MLRATRFFQHDQHARYDGKTLLLNITPLFVTNSRGIEVAKSIMSGDGFLAAFDGLARAVRCGRAIVGWVKNSAFMLARAFTRGSVR